MDSDIKMTDETREYIEWYKERLAEKNSQKQNKKAKQSKQRKVQIDQINSKSEFFNAITVSSFNEQEKFAQIKGALEKITEHLRKHTSLEGIEFKCTELESTRAESAAKYIETAIALLDSIKEG